MSALKVSYATWAEQGPPIMEAIYDMLRACGQNDATEVARLLEDQLPGGMSARTALSLLASTPEECALMADTVHRDFWVDIEQGPSPECRISLHVEESVRRMADTQRRQAGLNNITLRPDPDRRMLFTVLGHTGRWVAIPGGRPISGRARLRAG